MKRSGFYVKHRAVTWAGECPGRETVRQTDLIAVRLRIDKGTAHKR